MKPYYEEENITIYNGDCLEVMKELPSNSIDMSVTSPPYWQLRNYGVEGQLGQEIHFNEYINRLCNIFDEIKRVLKKEGSCWVNIDDIYGNSNIGVRGNIKGLDKCLLQIPSRFAIEMVNRGWILRNTIIWNKPNSMPDSVKDRFTVDFEYLFFFVKQKKYYFKQQLEKSIWADRDYRSKIKGGVKSGGKTATGNYAINKVAYTENGMKNKRSVWAINTKPHKEAHFAVYPPELITTPIKACCPINGTILDPFMGSGTTLEISKKLNRKCIGIEINKDYCDIAVRRLGQEVFNFAEDNQ